MRRHILSFICFFSLSVFAFSQDHGHGQDDGHGHEQHATEEHHGDSGCGHHEAGPFNPGATAFHHISDQNIYNIGPFSMPLPCFLYAPEQGWSIFSSGRFHTDDHGHGNGHTAVDGYVLIDGMVHRVRDNSFPEGTMPKGRPFPRTSPLYMVISCVSLITYLTLIRNPWFRKRERK